MHPLRIVILGILLYILYRLLVGGMKKKQEAASRKSSADLPAHDVLIEDPVCHTYIPKGQSISLSHGDETLHFCSEKCRDAFLAQKGKDD